MTTNNPVSHWAQIKNLLEQQEETNSSQAAVFLKYLVPLTLNEREFTLATNKSFVQDWVVERYLKFIETISDKLLDNHVDVSIILTSDNFSPVDTPPHSDKINLLDAYPTPITNAIFSSGVEDNIKYSLESQQQYQPKDDFDTILIGDSHHRKTNTTSTKEFSFETYVTGDSNMMAFNTARSVAETPGEKFNPLFIYGHSGLGKTHLLLAINDYVQHNHVRKKVIYASTSDFVTDFTNAMGPGNRDMTEFNRKYRYCDFLLLDDVQHLEGKEGSTNALFDILNAFQISSRQIVLSADRAPNEINLDQRYTSRFNQGVVVDITTPSFEMKLAIFNNYKRYCCVRMGIDNINIPDGVLEHIINLSGSNIRELEGATMSLVVYLAFGRPEASKYKDITIEEAEKVVGGIFLNNERHIDIHTIQKEVENYFSISHVDLISSQRSQNITYPRQVAMYLSRSLTDKSYPEIAKAFGGKDHTTVIYAIKNVEKKFMQDPVKKSEIERLMSRINK